MSNSFSPSLSSLVWLMSFTIGGSCSLLEQYGFPDSPQGATAFAFVYGEPLLYFEQEFNGSVGLSLLGTNNYRLANHGNLANSSVDEVIHPNVDTLYSIAVLDFSENDVEVYVPPYETDRVVVVDFWDPYGSCYDTISSIRASTPGTYLLRPNLQGGPTAPKNCGSKYQGCINSPTGQATMIVRVGVNNNGTDEDYSRSYISNFTVIPVNKHTATFTPLTALDFTGLPKNKPQNIIQLLARLAHRNPPQTAEYANEVPEILKMAGISNGTYIPVPDVDIDAAYDLANKTVLEYSTTPASRTTQNNGWGIINPDIQGAFENGTALLGRNWWGYNSYLDNVPREAIYPMPESNAFNLTRDESLLVVFHSKPQIASPGLWSLTAYDKEGYLVANPMNVYEVGDRSNLTYPDGTLVYSTFDNSSSSSSHSDGSFQLLIQRVDVPPPSNWTHNWLPSPANDEDFTLTFRLYNPLEAMKNGQYQYPTFVKQAAVTGNCTQP